MTWQFNLQTKNEGFYNITAQLHEALAHSGITEGICTVFCPHTTAGITINENADPDVVHDMLLGLAKAFPHRNEYLHAEGNSAAHLKASCLGSSCQVLVHNGNALLGTWQGVYFCEFDGPRNRIFYISVN